MQIFNFRHTFLREDWVLHKYLLSDSINILHIAHCIYVVGQHLITYNKCTLVYDSCRKGPVCDNEIMTV